MRYTGIKPQGTGTHQREDERKRYKIRYCTGCTFDGGGHCTVVGHREYTDIRFGDMNGTDCFFREEA